MPRCGMAKDPAENGRLATAACRCELCTGCGICEVKGAVLWRLVISVTSDESRSKEDRMKKYVALLAVMLLCAGVAFSQTGMKKKRPLPFEYGRVIMNNYSDKAGLAPVVFDHWLHRTKFTCRLCHVDIGFAMKSGATEIKASDNISGYYCGTCHNG